MLVFAIRDTQSLQQASLCFVPYSLNHGVSNNKQTEEKHDEQQQKVEVMRGTEDSLWRDIGDHDRPTPDVHDSDELDNVQTDDPWCEEQTHPARQQQGVVTSLGYGMDQHLSRKLA